MITIAGAIGAAGTAVLAVPLPAEKGSILSICPSSGDSNHVIEFWRKK